MRLFLIFVLLYAYAAIRYHVAKEQIDFIHFPFVLNKAIAWTAGTLFVLSILPDKILQKFQLGRRVVGVWGYRLAVVHILASILLLCPELYPKFYTETTLNSAGWRHILFGASSIALFTVPLWASWKNAPNNDYRYRFGRWGILMNLVHVASIGASGWLKVDTWPWLMPPITLLFVGFGVFVVILRYTRYSKN
jgi:hypothetical protein